METLDAQTVITDHIRVWFKRPDLIDLEGCAAALIAALNAAAGVGEVEFKDATITTHEAEPAAGDGMGGLKSGWLAEELNSLGHCPTCGQLGNKQDFRKPAPADHNAALRPAASEEHVERALNAERLAIADEARRYASHYSRGSDGQNTFIMLAEWIEARRLAAAPPTAPSSGLDAQAREIMWVALTRIAGSRANDMSTLHPDSCAVVAQKAMQDVRALAAETRGGQ